MGDIHKNANYGKRTCSSENIEEHAFLLVFQNCVSIKYHYGMNDGFFGIDVSCLQKKQHIELILVKIYFVQAIIYLIIRSIKNEKTDIKCFFKFCNNVIMLVFRTYNSNGRDDKLYL